MCKHRSLIAHNKEICWKKKSFIKTHNSQNYMFTSPNQNNRLDQAKNPLNILIFSSNPYPANPTEQTGMMMSTAVENLLKSRVSIPASILLTFALRSGSLSTFIHNIAATDERQELLRRHFDFSSLGSLASHAEIGH